MRTHYSGRYHTPVRGHGALPAFGIALFVLCLTPGLHAVDAIVCKVRAALSSHGSISERLRRELRGAHDNVLVALYGFNNPLLAHELMELAKRGVTVRVKIDAEKAAKRKTRKLISGMRGAGVEVHAVAEDGRNHNKFTVIDGKRVIAGSYNWTTRADRNWENLLFLDCPELAQQYEAEWRKIE